ncbi:S-adenosyl-L-methionine-dependent methyltransferase [Fomes fomentarius]|nr:S-adenosyl-L-methionine-dependent methyltransferase [Fomes fomentarius]
MDWHNPEVAKRYQAAEALTGPFALDLIKQCGLDQADGSMKLIVLDNACGTGVVTLNLYAALSPAARENLELVSGDVSPSMVKSVQGRIERNGWKGATSTVVDAQKMDLPANYFTHVLTNFGLVGFPRPRDFLAEAFRVLQPGGIAGITIWKEVEWYPIVAEAIASIPDAPPAPSYTDFARVFLENPGDDEWLEPAFFEAEIRKVGFADVKTVVHTNVLRLKHAEEYVELYATPTKMVLFCAFTEEQKAKVSPHFDEAVMKVLKAKFGNGEVALRLDVWGIVATKV